VFWCWSISDLSFFQSLFGFWSFLGCWFKVFPYWWSRLFGAGFLTLTTFDNFNIHSCWFSVSWSFVRFWSLFNFLLLLFLYFFLHLFFNLFLNFRRIYHFLTCRTLLYRRSWNYWFWFWCCNFYYSSRFRYDWCWLHLSSSVTISYHESSNCLWLYGDSRHAIFVSWIHEKRINWGNRGCIFTFLLPVSSWLPNFFNGSDSTGIYFRNFDSWKLCGVDTGEI